MASRSAKYQIVAVIRMVNPNKSDDSSFRWTAENWKYSKMNDTYGSTMLVRSKCSLLWQLTHPLHYYLVIMIVAVNSELQSLLGACCTVPVAQYNERTKTKNGYRKWKWGDGVWAVDRTCPVLSISNFYIGRYYVLMSFSVQMWMSSLFFPLFSLNQQPSWYGIEWKGVEWIRHTAFVKFTCIFFYHITNEHHINFL